MTCWVAHPVMPALGPKAAVRQRLHSMTAADSDGGDSQAPLTGPRSEQLIEFG